MSPSTTLSEGGCSGWQNYQKSAETQKSSHVRAVEADFSPKATIMSDQDWHASPEAFMSDENTCLTQDETGKRSAIADNVSYVPRCLRWHGVVVQ